MNPTPSRPLFSAMSSVAAPLKAPNPITNFLLRAAFALLIAGSAVALPLRAALETVILFRDSFDGGAAPTLGNDADDPTDTTWSHDLAAEVGTDPEGILASGNSALLSLPVAGKRLGREIFTRFPDAPLAVGETLTASFTLRLVAPSDVFKDSTQVRVALGRLTGTDLKSGSSYAFEIATGVGDAGTLTQFRHRAATATAAGDATTLQPPQALQSINDVNTHAVVFSITRTSATEITLKFQLDGRAPVFAATTLGVDMTSVFNRFSILAVHGPFACRLDNLSLVKTVVQAPTKSQAAAAPSNFLLYDTFDPTSPSKITWSGLIPGKSSMVINKDDGALSGSNSLLFNAVANYVGIYANFPKQTLEVGDTLTLTFRMRNVGALPVGSSQFRIGFINAPNPAVFSTGRPSDGHGYAFGMGGAGSTNFQYSYRRTSSILGGDSTPLPNATPHEPQSISGSLSHTMRFSITRADVDENVLVFSMDENEWVTTVTAKDSTLNDFNRVGFYYHSPGSFRLDDVKLVFVPGMH